jgi:hypothetical protein
MSYDVVKNYIAGRIKGLGYIESKSAFNFSDAPVTEYDKCFIVMPIKGSIDPDGANLNISIFDSQEWTVQIAFSKSTHSDIIKRDDMLRSIEAIIKDLDNPNNYSATVDLIRYQEWSVVEQENYYLLTITFEIRDQYTY